MKTTAVRLYGKNDLRLESFELPPIQDDEILARVISDSLCHSSYKAAIQGAEHKRVPNDVADHPIIIGHEFCGQIVEVGAKWQKDFTAGDKFAIQPALNYKGTLDAPGYSYQYIGGDATYVIIPNEVMACGCLLKYSGNAYFYGSLAEPVSCVIGGFHANYHMSGVGYEHKMDIVPGGYSAILAGAGPMGLGAIDYAVNGPIKPGVLVVTDIDSGRLARAAQIISPEYAKTKGVNLYYVNTNEHEDALAYLMGLTGGHGYDDVFVYAPVTPVVEMGDAMLARDGCLNFFAGPTDTSFSAKMNFYDVHYDGTHVTTISGSKTSDLIEALELMSNGTINPATMISHIGGLNAAAETTLNLHHFRAGKMLIYTGKDIPLTAIADFDQSQDPFFKALGGIVARNNGLWCVEAEQYLLEHAKDIVVE